MNKPLILFLLVLFSMTSCKNEESQSEPVLPLNEVVPCHTDLLCRGWKLVQVNGESVEGTSDELIILFSKSAAYYVEFKTTMGNNTGGLSQWKWDGEAHAKLMYSWDEAEDWSRTNGVEIIELSASLLKLRESHQGEESEYRLVPIDDKVASHHKSSNSAHESRIKKGFLKR